MQIDEKTCSLLTGKLQFTEEHINKLEHNAGMLARTMNLLSMIQRSPNQQAVRQFVLVQLKKIRQTLDEASYTRTNALIQARAEYYTFQRAFR